MLAWLLLACIILVPRYYLWGSAPAGFHGDEGGFSALGMEVFAAPPPLWSFGPQSLPNAHFWLYGAALELFGFSVWSARFATSVFGVLQAFAITDVARRTGGLAAAFTAALVMAMPLQLHFDRLAMCNVMTTATWAVALWCVVRWPTRLAAGFAAGALLALGWYAYQASRIAPVVALAGIVPLLFHPTTRGVALRMSGAGLLGFALVILPIAYGYYLNPQFIIGRAQTTSWMSQSTELWAGLVEHVRDTVWAMLGMRFDASGGFFPFDLPVVPIGIAVLAIVGLIACRSTALRCSLLVWIALVLAANVVRIYPIYAPVLVCVVPALALAGAYSARWLGWLAPAAAALAIALPVHDYLRAAVRIPSSEILPMAQAQLLRDLPHVETVVVAGGVGCGHGMTTFALRGRSCFGPEKALNPPRPAQLYILFPPFFALDQPLSTQPRLHRYLREWNSTPVHIWSTVPLPLPSPS